MYFTDGVQLLEKLTKEQADPKDERWEIVHDLLYRGGLERSKFRFMERYSNGVLVFHLHGVLVDIHKMQRLVEFCATCEPWDEKRAGDSAWPCNDVPSMNCGNSGIQASMFVDVREEAQHPEKLMPAMRSIVRLQTLDECKRRFGNAIGNRALAKITPGDGRDFRGITGRIETKRELQSFGDLVGHGANPIPFDKIEKHMIERRPELVEDFASNHGEFNRRVLDGLQCWYAIRLSDYSVRLTAAVFGDAIFQGLTLLQCPEDFCLSGLPTSSHTESIAGSGILEHK